MTPKAYDRESHYPFLAWLKFNFRPSANMDNQPGVVRLTLEIRDAPLGKTEKILHEVILPENFIRRAMEAEEAQQAVEREFYKNA